MSFFMTAQTGGETQEENASVVVKTGVLSAYRPRPIDATEEGRRAVGAPPLGAPGVLRASGGFEGP